MSVKNPSSSRLVGSVVVAALLSGVMLSGVFTITEPLIRANQAEATRKAIFEVLPGTASFRTLAIEDGRIVVFDDAQGQTPDQPLYMGLTEQGSVSGYAIPGEGTGFGGRLAVLFGYQPAEHKVVGLAVLESLETPGLGDKIEKDEAFVNSFLDLLVQPEIICAKQREKANEVDSISGATISSKAVVRILNQRLASLPDHFPQALKERQE